MEKAVSMSLRTTVAYVILTASARDGASQLAGSSSPGSAPTFCRALDADLLQHGVPELTDLLVTPFHGGADGITGAKQVLSLEEHDLGLHQASTFELDAPQRHDKWVLG